MSLSTIIKDLQKMLIGRHNGIIKEIKLFEPYPGSLPYYYGYAALCDVGLLNQTISFQPPAAGIGTCYEKAMIGILGEAIERYCASFPQTDQITTGSLASLSKQYPVISGENLATYSMEQYDQTGFPYQRQAEDDTLEWQIATDFNGDRILVPAAYVYIPYQSKYKNLIPSNSTGLACGPDSEYATLNALYEVIERDAYSLCWLYSGSPPRLNIDKQINLIEKIPCYFYDDWKIDFYDLTGIEGIPVILCILHAPRNYALKTPIVTSVEGGKQSTHWYCHGVAAHSNPEEALIKAFNETILSYYFLESKWQDYMSRENSTAETKDPLSFDEHAEFYNFNPQHLQHCDFIRKGSTVRWGQSKGTSQILEPGLNSIKHRLDQYNVTGINIDLSTQDIKNMNMHVSRVILTGFNWLQGDNRMPTLGSLRARNPHLYYDYIQPFEKNNVHRRNLWPHSLG